MVVVKFGASIKQSVSWKKTDWEQISLYGHGYNSPEKIVLSFLCILAGVCCRGLKMEGLEYQWLK